MNIGGQTARLNADDLAPHVSDHAYEPQDRRIETVSNGTPTRSVFSGRDILGEYGADWNAAQAHDAYAGLDQPLLKTTARAPPTTTPTAWLPSFPRAVLERRA